MSQRFENGYAVVIGVDQSQLPTLSLEPVGSDVAKLHGVLIHPQRCAYNSENVKLVTGKDATKEKILSALAWLHEKVAADPNATAVVYYSGHGLRDLAAGQYYLVPYDVPSVDGIWSASIKAETFAGAIERLPAKRLLVLLDCCHAAGVDAKAAVPGAPLLEQVAFPLDDLPETKGVPVYEEGAKNVRQLGEGQGRAILNSSTGAQRSYLRGDRQMSLFTYHLIEALTGYASTDLEAETVLVTDVMSYVARQVKKTAKEERRQQTPVMRTTGVFPVALVLGGEGAKGASRLPDPLGPLPPAGTTFNQRAQTVSGHQVNIERDAAIDQVGNRTVHRGGRYAEEDLLEFSGDFRGAILNVRSTLQNVTQSIGNLPHGSADDKGQLIDLLRRLEEELDRGAQLADRPSQFPDDVEKLVKRVRAMVGEADSDNPDDDMIALWRQQIVKQAAEVGRFLPIIPQLVEQIVEQMMRMLP